jgi:hypothetical protein
MLLMIFYWPVTNLQVSADSAPDSAADTPADAFG